MHVLLLAVQQWSSRMKNLLLLSVLKVSCDLVAHCPDYRLPRRYSQQARQEAPVQCAEALLPRDGYQRMQQAPVLRWPMRLFLRHQPCLHGSLPMLKVHTRAGFGVQGCTCNLGTDRHATMQQRGSRLFRLQGGIRCLASTCFEFVTPATADPTYAGCRWRYSHGSCMLCCCHGCRQHLDDIKGASCHRPQAGSREAGAH